MISIQSGLRQPEKEKKNFSAEFRSYSTRVRKFQKNSKKIQEIKNIIPPLFLSKLG